MSNIVISLICNPAAPVLTNELSEEITSTLRQEGVAEANPNVLLAGVAEEYAVQSASHETLQAKVKGVVGDAPIDVNILPFENRRKKLLIADMDSTIIEQECIDELADFAGIRDEIAAVTERAMRGELDFESALSARVARLKGLTNEELEKAFREKITFTPGASTLTATMRGNGARAILASGGFTFFTERVAAQAGFNDHFSNILELEEGILTGRVKDPIFGRESKTATLKDEAGKLSIDLIETIAVGDGANDLGMIGAAGLGVAFHAKPAVADAADVSITHGDLTALLYLQGYSYAEFKTY